MLSCLILLALGENSGRDALPPSTGILDRADLQLRSLQDIDHGALSSLIVADTAARGGSADDPLPSMRLDTTAR